MAVPAMPHGRDAHATYEIDRLRRETKPFRLHWFPTLGSTSTHAARMRREGRLVAPAIVLTARQTAGRGRGNNVWRSPAGVVTVTFALSHHDTLAPQHVPLVAGLVVRDVVAEFGLTDAKIKWPNDVWLGEKKVAGLLCERIDRIDLIGIGLNVELRPGDLPGDLAPRATSIAAATGVRVDRNDVLIALAKRLHATFADARTSFAAALPSLRAHDALAGRQVRVTAADGVTLGRADGIDAEGRLLVCTPTGTAAIVAGSVSLA